MRPRHTILLVSCDEDRAGTLSYMLNINGYAVRYATSSFAAIDLLRAAPAELLICELPCAGVEALLDWAHVTDSFMNTLCLAPKSWMRPEGYFADATLTRPVNSSELLERTKILCARKRGPRKKGPLPVAVMSAAEVRLA